MHIIGCIVLKMVLILKLNNKSKLIFVANHLKWKYENHFHKLNLSKRSFTLFGPPKYSYLEKFSFKDFEIRVLELLQLNQYEYRKKLKNNLDFI